MKLSEFIRAHRRSLARGGQDASVVVALEHLLLSVADEMDATSRMPQRFCAGLTPPRHSRLVRAAERVARALPLDSLVSEHAALRARVLRAWSHRRPRHREESSTQILCFNEILDRSLSSAVASYSQALRRAERQQVELNQKLAKSEQRFRALVNATSTAVFRLGPDGRELQEVSGRGTVADKDTPTANWVDEYVYPDDQQKAAEAFREAARSKSLLEVEHRYRRIDGKLRWALSRAVPLLDGAGQITEWFGAAIDVTARRRAQQARRNADRSKDEFLAVLGHELRNPLAPLRTALDLLEHARARPELLDRLRPMMDRQLAHLVRLADDLLDIARIGRGEVTLQRRPLDLNEPIEAALEQARAAIAQRRHQLEVQLSTAPLPVEGDYVRLTQIVSNLLNNAAKYMDPGGTITVTSSADDGRAVVRVRDRGYGIPPERFHRLFKLFSRIPEHTAQTGGNGLGVGLALCHQLVALHGGSIEAQSDGLGKGSEFVLRLDLKHVDTLAPAPRESTAAGQCRSARADRGGQRRCRGESAHAACPQRARGAHRPRRLHGARAGDAIPAPHRVAGPRAARYQRLRGRPPDPRVRGGRRCAAGGGDGVGAAGPPAGNHRGGIRRTHHQAGGRLRARPADGRRAGVGAALRQCGNCAQMRGVVPSGEVTAARAR